MNSDLKTIIRAAKAGSKILNKYFGQTLDLAVEEKTGRGDIKTKAALEPEKIILKII